MPGVEVSGALGNVWSYDFGDYEVVFIVSYMVVERCEEKGGCFSKI